MKGFDELRREEGNALGREPGKGAVIHSSTGEADFDGRPGDALPPRKELQKDQPFPPERASD